VYLDLAVNRELLDQAKCLHGLIGGLSIGEAR
jgi:hypothetical protein